MTPYGHLLFHLILVAFVSGCTGNETVIPVAKENPRVSRQTIVHPDSRQKQIEFYWARPKAEGPWPVLIYIHGHQERQRPGGKDLADGGVLERMARRGVVAVSVSQPGYGQSDGPPDFCGPYTQHAVMAVVAELRKWKFVNPDKIGLYGISRGAVVASLVEAQDRRLAAAILVAGFYDFEKSYQNLIEEARTNAHARGMVENIQAESGATSEDIRARSAILSANQIRTPTLIINGERDFRVAVPDIVEFESLIKANDVPVKAVIFSDYGHFVPLEERNKEINPFLEKYLGLAPEAN